LLSALDGSEGVVWVAGCGGALIRVVPPGLAQRVPDPVVQPDTAKAAFPDLSTVRALCPDEAVLGALDSYAASPGAVEHGEVYELTRTTDPALPPVVRPFAPNVGIRSWGLHIQGVSAILGGAQDLMSLTHQVGVASRHVDRQFAAAYPFAATSTASPPAPFEYPIVFLGGARNDRGEFLLNSAFGDTVLATPVR
jgi:hypothetical protein